MTRLRNKFILKILFARGRYLNRKKVLHHQLLSLFFVEEGHSTNRSFRKCMRCSIQKKNQKEPWFGEGKAKAWSTIAKKEPWLPLEGMAKAWSSIQKKEPLSTAGGMNQLPFVSWFVRENRDVMRDRDHLSQLRSGWWWLKIERSNR